MRLAAGTPCSARARRSRGLWRTIQRGIVGLVARALISTSIVGCTTVETIQGRPAEVQQRVGGVRAGDQLVIRTHDGTAHKMTLRNVRDGALVSDRESVAIDQIAGIEKRSFSAARTARIVGTVLLVALAVAAMTGLVIAASTPHLPAGPS